MQSYIASKHATLMTTYTIVVNKRLMSLKTAGFGSLVNIRKKINLETSEHAFMGKPDFSDTVEISWWGVYIGVSRTKHGIMQVKTPDYMRRVNTKLVNCNLNFVT